MSGGPNNFLARWSRRKLGPDPTEPAETLPPALDEQHALSTPQPGVAGEGAELSAEELAALPSIDELTPDTDISAFLRHGVPDLIRKAALRRMWSLDPTIRDYVGDARDYAWDWNVPGGVPGYAPLLPGGEAEAAVRRMFSDPPASDRAALATQREPVTAETNGEGAQAEAASGDEDQAGAKPILPDRRDIAPPETLAETSQNIPEAVVLATSDSGRDGEPPNSASSSPERPRRHGAARPKFERF